MAKQKYVADKKIVQAMREAAWAARRGDVPGIHAALARATALTEAKLQYEAEERERWKVETAKMIQGRVAKADPTDWDRYEVRKGLGHHPDLAHLVPEGWLPEN